MKTAGQTLWGNIKSLKIKPESNPKASLIVL